MRTHNIAGQVMGSLEAFEGSRAALDTAQILIVRGMSRKKIAADKLEPTITQLFKDMEVVEMDMFSDEAGDIIGVIDEQIRSCVEISGETDAYGIYRMKESFESMNCNADYKMGILNDEIAIFLVLWKDKSGMGPLFVEMVISLMEA
ncbi:MAG TPA: DUF2120 domain-containing protein [Methanobacteriaceae archaeon]|nr:DUF2120 domain-containing protein [Methanobacteriaceae archaeon]